MFNLFKSEPSETDILEYEASEIIKKFPKGMYVIYDEMIHRVCCTINTYIPLREQTNNRGFRVSLKLFNVETFDYIEDVDPKLVDKYKGDTNYAHELYKIARNKLNQRPIYNNVIRGYGYHNDSWDIGAIGD